MPVSADPSRKTTRVAESVLAPMGEETITKILLLEEVGVMVALIAAEVVAPVTTLAVKASVFTV
jgi:hypothetical protein